VQQCLWAGKLKASKAICVEANVSISDAKQSRRSEPIMNVIISVEIVPKLDKTSELRINVPTRRLRLTFAVQKQEV
jgi:hypothetical protein